MVIGNNTASDFSKIWKILKYYKMVLSPNTKYRSYYYLLIIEAEKFSITHKRPLFRYGSKSKRGRQHFVTIFSRPNIQTRLVVLTLSSFVFFVTALTVNFCTSSPDISRNLAAMFWKIKT